MQRWWKRSWWVLWLGLCALLLLAAPLKRHLNCAALGGRMAAQLEAAARRGSLLEDYLWGDYSAGLGAVQGPAIWLIRQGYEDPALLRMLLLAEGQRLYAHIYTYPRCMNADLRRGLIARCLDRRLQPDLDLEYAGGSLALALGDTANALPMLQRAQQALPRWELEGYASGTMPVPDARHVLGRYCAALTLSGRDDEVEALLQGRVRQRSRDADYAWVYAHWLADHGRWDEVLPLCIRFRDSDARGDWAWLEREAQLQLGAADAYLALLKGQEADLAEKAAKAADQWSAEDFRQASVAAQMDARKLQYLLEGMEVTDPEALGRRYVLRRDDAALDAIASRAAVLDGAWPGSDSEWDLQDQWQRERFACGMWLVRGRIQQGRWAEAQTELGKIGPAMFWDEAADRDWQELLLLTRIALGQPLDAPIAERRGADNRAEWEAADRAAQAGSAAAGPESDAAAADEEEYIDSSLIQQPGLFSALRDGDRLTAMLRSPDYAAALKQSGRTQAQLLPEILRVSQPALERYSDWSNGDLPKGW